MAITHELQSIPELRGTSTKMVGGVPGVTVWLGKGDSATDLIEVNYERKAWFGEGAFFWAILVNDGVRLEGLAGDDPIIGPWAGRGRSLTKMGALAGLESTLNRLGLTTRGTKFVWL